MKNVNVNASAKRYPSLDAFNRLKRRDFKAATPKEAWQLMGQIVTAASNGSSIPVEAALWLSSAMKRSVRNDAQSMIRELGLIERGQPRKYDRYAISDRVDDLIKGGMSIMASAKLAGEEFGCSYKTAHHYGVRIRSSIIEDRQNDQ